MTDQIWALLDGSNYCVGEYVGATPPTERDTSTGFSRAVRVERRGDMMTENLVIDPATGIGGWVVDTASKRRSDQLDRLNRMDRVEFLDFVLAEARAGR